MREVVQVRLGVDVLAKKMGPHPPDELTELVRGVLTGGDGEDDVKLLCRGGD